MTRARRAALLLGAVAVGGALVLAGLRWFVATHADRLLAAVGGRLGREVHASRLGISLLRGLGVVLEEVRIADDPAFATPEPFLAARSLEMRLGVLPLLARRVAVERIVVEEPVVNLVRAAGGRMNVDSLRERARDPAPAPATATAAGGAERSASFQLAMLRLRHGTIRYRDVGAARALELTAVALDARQPSFDAPMPTSLRARLATDGLRLDDIVSEGVLDLGETPPAYRGTLTAGPGALGPLAVARLGATLEAKPPALVLTDAKLELLGGAVTGTARVASEGEGAGLTAQIAAQGLDLAQLPAPPERPHPAGTLALQADLSGPPPANPAFRLALTGTGHFDVADGRIDGIPLGRSVRELLGPLLGEQESARLRERYPDLFSGDDALRFTRLSGSGRLAGGRIRSDDIVLAAPSYDARGAGSLGLDGTIDAELRLSASPALTDDVLGHSKARPFLVDDGGRLTIPLRVRGPLLHPAVTPDPRFTATVARALLGGADVGEAANSLLERLLGGRRRRGR